MYRRSDLGSPGHSGTSPPGHRTRAGPTSAVSHSAGASLLPGAAPAMPLPSPSKSSRSGSTSCAASSPPSPWSERRGGGWGRPAPPAASASSVEIASPLASARPPAAEPPGRSDAGGATPTAAAEQPSPLAAPVACAAWPVSAAAATGAVAWSLAVLLHARPALLPSTGVPPTACAYAAGGVKAAGVGTSATSSGSSSTRCALPSDSPSTSASTVAVLQGCSEYQQGPGSSGCS
jgi:hypothetical protein